MFVGVDWDSVARVALGSSVLFTGIRGVLIAGNSHSRLEIGL